MIKTPPALQKGALIGIVAPSGFMAFEKMDTCINTLQDWGYSVRMGATTHSHSVNYFSGTDEERLQDLQDMLDDRDVSAILCARGGYGMSRIIDRLSFKKFKKHPKWIVGFSDITVLHSHILANYGIATLHAPMAAAFNDGGFSSPYIQSLKDSLEGRPVRIDAEAHPFNKHGVAEAELVGGNLTLLAHLIGTPSDVKTKHRILFLEDVGEYIYNVDRMLLQLKRSGKLDKLEGLIIGGFTDMKDTERPFGMSVHEAIHAVVKDLDIPVCFDFPISHATENYAVKIGGRYSLSVSATDVVLEESVPEE